MTNRKLTLAVFSLLALQLGIFFWSLNTVCSDSSWANIGWFEQLTYNFWHGRWFQTSLFRIPQSGELSSPYSYFHCFCDHFMYTSDLMAWPQRFHPSVNTLYMTDMAYTLLAIPVFVYSYTMLLLQNTSQNLAQESKLHITLSVCLVLLTWGAFYTAITYKCHPITYTPIFFLASYYLAQRNNFPGFFVCALAVILAQEDCGLWIGLYAVYLAVFERKRNAWVYVIGAFGIFYYGIVQGVLQPAIKSCIPHRLYKGDAAYTFDTIIFPALRDPRRILPAVRKVSYSLLYPAVLLATANALEKLKKEDWAILVLPPGVYWFSVGIGRGGYHAYIPGICSMVIVLTRIAVRWSSRPPRITWSQGRKYAVGCALLFTGILSHRLGLIQDLHTIAASYSVVHHPRYGLEKMASNKKVAVLIQRIPITDTLCFWTSRNIQAFIADRSDVWMFPHNFDRTDWFVIQKNSNDTFFETTRPFKDSELAELAEGNYDSPVVGSMIIGNSGQYCTVRASDADFFKNLLVHRRKSHTIYLEDADVLVLKAKTHTPIYQPPFTKHFFWW